MSFRNSNFHDSSNIKIEQEAPSQLQLSSSFPKMSKQSAVSQSQVLSKLSQIIINLHENYLLKCQDLQIYRDMPLEEQQLLLKVDKNTVLHKILAGVLAIDSCAKALEKEQQFAFGNIVRALSTLISTIKAVNQGKEKQQVKDSIKYLTLHLLTLPVVKGRQAELEKQLKALQGQESQFQNQRSVLLSQLQQENDMLKLAIREKQSHIKTVETMLDKSNRLQKRQQRRTAHSLGLRMKTQKSSEAQSQSQNSLNQLQQELFRVRDELNQKHNIILKMNDQFASEMEKYNSVFKRLEEENKVLKRYQDIDTVVLLQELQMEIEMLKEQRNKDQMIIGDIQRQFQGFSFNRNNRGNHQYNRQQSNYQNSYYHNYERQHIEPHSYHPYPSGRHVNNFERQRIPSKFYSPNYSSRMVPYEGRPSYRQESSFLPQQNSRSRIIRKGEDLRDKSRGRYQGMHTSRQRELIQSRSSPNVNLLERVLSKY